MKEYLDIGSAPPEEECAQVGSDDYHDRAPRECRAWIHQLERYFGKPPSGTRFTFKSFPHDAGNYYLVVLYYDNEETFNFANKVQSECPERWDAEALAELAQYGYNP